MSAAGDELNIEQDYNVVRGATVQIRFRVQPFDGTNATASLVTDLGTFPMIVLPTLFGTQIFTDFSYTFPASFTATQVSGVYNYHILTTMPDGTVIPMGQGSLVVL